MMTDWRSALSADELAPGSARVVRVDGRQVALFRTADGAVHAVDNRCPHEGYPLVTGKVSGCLLTCEWHNWKFRLTDGACELGGEDVRSYPVRIDDGAIWIDLAEPEGERTGRLYRSLADAIDEADWGQAARAIVRLREAGVADREILGWSCAWAADHAPYGFDHGGAAAADLAALLPLVPGEEPAVLLQALHLLCEPHVRRPARVWPAPEPPGPDAGAELRRRIEAEELDRAEALMAGAIAAGVPTGELFDWLTAAATDHFLDFGHAQIYCVKAEELLEVVGRERAHPILTSLVSSIGYGTREDRLPYMRRFVRAAAPYRSRLADWAARAPESAVALDADRFLSAVLDGELEDALEAVAGALDRGVAPDRVALALALAGAHRILRFDPAIERRDLTSEGWLHVTHTMTHADAVRESVRRRATADSLRGLLHSARFVQHMRPLDRADAGGLAVAAPAPPDPDELVRGSLSDRLTLPIFVAHHVKIAACARRLAADLAADPELGTRSDWTHPLSAAALLLGQPLDERRITRRARVARRFVVDGEMQEKLLGY